MKLLSPILALTLLLPSIHAGVIERSTELQTSQNHQKHQTCISGGLPCETRSGSARCCTGKDGPRQCQHIYGTGFKDGPTCHTCIPAWKKCTNDPFGPSCCSNSTAPLTCHHIKQAEEWVVRDEWVCQPCVLSGKKCDKKALGKPCCSTSDTPKSCQSLNSLDGLGGSNDEPTCQTCVLGGEKCTPGGHACCPNKSDARQRQCLRHGTDSDEFTCQPDVFPPETIYYPNSGAGTGVD